MSDEEILPIAVVVKNWSDRQHRRVVSTSLKTIIIDPTGAAGPKFVQICTYEPNRTRMVVKAIDDSIAITLEKPTNSPDVSTASAAPQGYHVPSGTNKLPDEFFGPDAMWANATGLVTRVTVLKEYC